MTTLPDAVHCEGLPDNRWWFVRSMLHECFKHAGESGQLRVDVRDALLAFVKRYLDERGLFKLASLDFVFMLFKFLNEGTLEFLMLLIQLG